MGIWYSRRKLYSIIGSVEGRNPLKNAVTLCFWKDIFCEVLENNANNWIQNANNWIENVNNWIQNVKDTFVLAFTWQLVFNDWIRIAIYWKQNYSYWTALIINWYQNMNEIQANYKSWWWKWGIWYWRRNMTSTNGISYSN